MVLIKEFGSTGLEPSDTKPNALPSIVFIVVVTAGRHSLIQRKQCSKSVEEDLALRCGCGCRMEAMR